MTDDGNSHDLDDDLATGFTRVRALPVTLPPLAAVERSARHRRVRAVAAGVLLPVVIGATAFGVMTSGRDRGVDAATSTPTTTLAGPTSLGTSLAPSSTPPSTDSSAGDCPPAPTVTLADVAASSIVAISNGCGTVVLDWNGTVTGYIGSSSLLRGGLWPNDGYRGNTEDGVVVSGGDAYLLAGQCGQPVDLVRNTGSQIETVRADITAETRSDAKSRVTLTGNAGLLAWEINPTKCAGFGHFDEVVVADLSGKVINDLKGLTKASGHGLGTVALSDAGRLAIAYADALGATGRLAVMDARTGSMSTAQTITLAAGCRLENMTYAGTDIIAGEACGPGNGDRTAVVAYDGTTLAVLSHLALPVGTHVTSMRGAADPRAVLSLVDMAHVDPGTGGNYLSLDEFASGRLTKLDGARPCVGSLCIGQILDAR